MKLVSAFFLFFLIFLVENTLGDNIIGGGNSVPKKKVQKRAPEPLIDVHELIGDMVKKEEELVKLSKKKSTYKTATTILATALGVVSALLLGGTGLVLYNTERGRHPFKIGSSNNDNAAPPAPQGPEPQAAPAHDVGSGSGSDSSSSGSE
ncbi:exported protein 1, putative [Plasmodium ovale]|uniref:Exported protein 1, putative n=1 Tax=Plasmodium ovale TaxID=36330 RepID=A0A1C3KSG5_PLAOA|nr:exported protein 1, putative [Plasmodium ovale]